MSDDPVPRRYCLGVSSIPPVDEREDENSDEDYPRDPATDVPTEE